MAGISFDKDGLANAASTFGDLQDSIKKEMRTIISTLETIDSNWQGPQHDIANADKIKAETCLQEVGQTIENMNEALAELSTNASKVSYNG